MAKGVKKIKYVEGRALANLSKPDVELVFPAEEYVFFTIGEWFSGTTKEDQQKELTWTLQDRNKRKNTILMQKTIKSKLLYGIKLNKKLAGDYRYYVEASLSGKRDFTNFTGLWVRAVCPPRIKSTEWRSFKVEANIKNKNKTQCISYGDIIHLFIETEGLNGTLVDVEIYNRQTLQKDKLIYTYTKCQITNGELLLTIKNTFSWRVAINHLQPVEQFYIKIKDRKTKKYIVDDLNDDLHAIYLNIKDGISGTTIQKSTNVTATKVYEPSISKERYEPCKFETIKITESKKEKGKAVDSTVTVFDNGKGIKKIISKGSQEHIVREIYFDFDSSDINKPCLKTLDNILRFLLEHPGSTITLTGYACVIGKQNYNNVLSQQRADKIKAYLGDGGLDQSRIIAIGKGEVNATDDKMGRDNIKYKDEKEYEQNRRVDISFVFHGHDAHTIIYNVIAPSISTKKYILIEVNGMATNSCFRNKNRHPNAIKMIDVGQAIDAGDIARTFNPPVFKYPVYSDLSRFNFFPLQYIWPAKTTPNQFHLQVHSCRYYSVDKRTTVLINAYPDIKWEFEFFINLSNVLSLKWQKLSEKKHKELRSNALKLANEAKGRYTGIDFGVILKASSDQDANGTYQSNLDFTLKYKKKIESLFSVISSVKDFAKGVTSVTKGVTKDSLGSKLPFQVSFNAPAFYLGSKWQADHNNAHNEIGTKLTVFFEAKPLIEVALIIDLLAMAVQAASTVTTGGAANDMANQIYEMVKTWINDGYQSERVVVKFDMYMDLVIKGKVSGTADTVFSTVSDKKEVNLSIASNIGVELKAGLNLKGAVVIVGTVKNPNTGLSVSGSLSTSISMGVTFEHKLRYASSEGIYYTPSLRIDPCIGKVVLMIKAGFSYKKVSKDWTPVNSNEERTFFEGFDIIETLTKLSGYENKILLWDKKSPQ